MRTNTTPITVAGWIFYFCTLLLSFLPAIQNELQKNIQDKKDFALDVTNKVLVNIRDSVKSGKVDVHPVLSICGPPCRGITFIDSTDNNYKFRVTLISQDAGSSFFDLKTSFVVEFIDGSRSYLQSTTGKLTLIPFKTRLVNGGTYYVDQPVSTGKEIKKIYIWIRGTYKRIDGSGSYEIDEIYFYQRPDTATQILIRDDLKNEILKFIREKEN